MAIWATAYWYLASRGPVIVEDAGAGALLGTARFTTKQRSDAAVPGSGGKLRVHVGDVTRGQVEVTLAHAERGVLVPATSMREGRGAAFAHEGRRYRLVLVDLDNRLVGDDHAKFLVTTGPTERERIEALIEAVARSEGLVFVRNGVEHGAKKAAGHLRRKWDAAGERIETAEQFIEHLASRSSITGEPYEIRLRHGAAMPAAAWFRARLAEFDARESQ